LLQEKIQERIYMKANSFNTIVIILSMSLSLVLQANAQTQYTKTPSDHEGPFYPVERQADEDNDLVNVNGKSESARGDILHVHGVVVDQQGNPQADVTIEIWQTDANGLYRHPRERAHGPRDPFFQYWGKADTDTDGTYSFTTLIPGEYAPRPPHIHFKVWVDGKVVLTSQMYIVADGNQPRVNEQLKLEIERDSNGEHSGFFRIVI
jgi:protocatechuate 3,4-dioxygenase beta subunit